MSLGRILCCLIGIVGIGLAAYFINFSNVFACAMKMLDENKLSGTLVYVLAFAVSTIVFFPPVILTYAGGVAFSKCFGVVHGTLIGTIAVLLGAIAGSSVSFWLGRFVIQDSVSNWCKNYKTLSAIDRAIQVNGVKILIMLRLSPLIPFGLFNYLISATQISYHEFIIGMIGIVPGTFAFVLIGALSADSNDWRIKFIACAIGLALVLGAMFYLRGRLYIGIFV